MKNRHDVMEWAESHPKLGVGKLATMRIAVAGLIFNDRGSILLHCRSDNAQDAQNCLEEIGGSLDESEDILADAIMRELREEVRNCTFSVDEFLDCSHIPFVDSEGQLKDWAIVTFLCSVVSGEPQVGEPGHTDGVGWFDLDDLATWDPKGPLRSVQLINDKSEMIERGVGLSDWVPVAVNAYISKYGREPWRVHRKPTHE